MRSGGTSQANSTFPANAYIVCIGRHAPRWGDYGKVEGAPADMLEAQQFTECIRHEVNPIQNGKECRLPTHNSPAARHQPFSMV